MYRCLFDAADRWQAVFQVCQNGYMEADTQQLIHTPPCVSDVTCITTDAAHANIAVSAPQRRTAQASSGRGSGRTSAEVSGAEQSSSNKMQTEEKSVGDVIREESGRAHSDQHAASGTQCTSCV